jgi:hypothetical protein
VNSAPSRCGLQWSDAVPDLRSRGLGRPRRPSVRTPVRTLN